MGPIGRFRSPSDSRDARGASRRSGGSPGIGRKVMRSCGDRDPSLLAGQEFVVSALLAIGGCRAIVAAAAKLAALAVHPGVDVVGADRGERRNAEGAAKGCTQKTTYHVNRSCWRPTDRGIRRCDPAACRSPPRTLHPSPKSWDQRSDVAGPPPIKCYANPSLNRRTLTAARPTANSQIPCRAKLWNFRLSYCQEALWIRQPRGPVSGPQIL